MVSRRAAPPAPQAAALSAEQMRTSIPKLERRIRDLEEFDPNSIQQRHDPRITALENKLTDTISEVFGYGTLEYNRFAAHDLDRAGYSAMRPTPLEAVIRSVADSKAREITNLRTIIELFNEKLADRGETSVTKARRAFGDLDLHPDISRACGQLFEDGHYAEAVENGCKVLDLMVKTRSMRTDPSGTELMQLVFSRRFQI